MNGKRRGIENRKGKGKGREKGKGWRRQNGKGKGKQKTEVKEESILNKKANFVKEGYKSKSNIEPAYP